ncbi:helix-turn-helix domain-containing protein [Micromonospora fluostatini]|uniref:helix-turn-helix domain-containing protein n=1 Tax=Micromonospora sp. JCM 30529 TaxID=3421643 RepID=UPI003D18336B
MGDDLPVGRRVAYWRARRNMSQQMFADRLGKSKSWVDKIERGVRRLDKWSVLQEVADALNVNPDHLLGDAAAAPPDRPADERAAEIGTLRAALTRHPGLLPSAVAQVEPCRYQARLDHAEAVYQHAEYPSLVRLLPDLLDGSHTREMPADLRVRVYRLTARIAVKLAATELAWLAADRGLAVATAADDPLLEAVAALPFGQALRAAGRPRSAFETTVVAAHRVTPLTDDPGTPDERSACAALLVQAALAAAEHSDPQTARDLLDDATRLTEPDGPERAAVDAARVTTTAALGDHRGAVDLHEALAARSVWRTLSIEHRAAYLLDVAGAYLAAGDAPGASRMLRDVDRIAAPEVRVRPAGRTMLAHVLAGSAFPDPYLVAVAEAAGVPGAW